MTVRARLLLGLLALLPFGACDDPLIVLGDQPGLMRRIAGQPDRAGATLDSLARNTLLRGPQGLAVADDGTLYIADTGNSRILEVSTRSRVRVVRGGTDCGSTCLVAPTGLVLDDEGGLWIADPDAGRLFRLDLRSGAMEARAGTGALGDAPDGTSAVDAILNRPSGVAIDADGTVYFSERGGDRVRRIDATGALQTAAGTGEPGYGGDGGPAASARLHEPTGLAIAHGRLFIADRLNHRVRAVDIAEGVIRTVAGSGVAGYSANDSIATAAALMTPEAVAVTADGRSLYIADTGNHRVRTADLATGAIADVAGTGDIDFTAELLDGSRTAMYRPAGVATGLAGMLFIADTGHQIVWRTRIRF